MSGPLVVPLERKGHPAPHDLVDLRMKLAAAVTAGQFHTLPAPVDARIGAHGHGHIRALRFRPEGRVRARVLHFHGGGYRMGHPEMDGPFADALARRAGVEVVVPHYRLAPEHPFPSAIVDGWAAVQALLPECGLGHNRVPLILSGVAAGGGLAAALALLAAQEGVALDGMILISPWLDLTLTAPSWAENASSDPVLCRQSAALEAELYLQGASPSHPLASPLYAPLGGIAPTLIAVGAGEVLVDDARRYHRALIAAGVSSRLEEVAGMEHAAVVRSVQMPGARRALDAIIAQVDRIAAGHAFRVEALASA